MSPTSYQLLHPAILVEGEGFEPSKPEAADLQSAPFNHSGISPHLSVRNIWSWQKELNPQPTDYKSVALPIELCQRFSFVTSVSIKDVGVFVNNFFKKSVRNFINQKNGG